MDIIFEPIDVLSLFAEVAVGQLGFQVVASAVVRRGGEVKVGVKAIQESFLQWYFVEFLH